MSILTHIAGWPLLAALVLMNGQAVQAQGKKSDSVVKATVKAEKADSSGKQAVTITLEIDPKYHLYANPIDNKDLEDAQTTVLGAGKTKLKDFFPESTKTVPAKFLGGPEAKLSEKEPYRPALAKWLTSAENPFFARAAVNRTWAQYFGRGIVDPVDDMHDGNEPSHPGLLAVLASELVGSGFDLKHLVRGICASKAYQRSSKPVPGAEHDPKLFATMAVKVIRATTLGLVSSK